MALSPIQMFQNNGSNSIEGLLRAGPEAISSIMNQAISLGRSMADKQLAQERDLFAMRQQETNLMQRRAENTQQDMEDAMRFNRSAFESDRRYGLDQQAQSRISANDAFSRDIQSRKMGLLESQFESEQAAAEEEKRKRAEDLLRFGERFNGGGETASPGAGTKTEEIVPTPTDNPRVSEIDKEIDALKKKKEDYATRFPGSSFDPTASIASLEAERTALTKSPKSARPTAVDVLGPTPTAPAPDELTVVRTELDLLEKETKPPENASPEALREYYSEINRLKKLEAELTAKPDAPKAPSTTAEEKETLGLFDNKTFFPPPVGKNPTSQKVEEAKLYEKDKVSNELTSASNMEEDEYVNKVPGLSPAGKAARKRVWNYAQKKFGMTGSTTTPPSNSPWNVPELR